MDDANRAPHGRGRTERGTSRWLERFLAVPAVRYPLVADPAPLRTLPVGGDLTFFLGRSQVQGPPLAPTVHVGDVVEAGQCLGRWGEDAFRPSPVAGTVTRVRQAPDVRGGKPGLAVTIAPSESGPDPSSRGPSPGAAFAPVDALRERVRVLAGPVPPRDAGTLAVLGADPEPGLSAALILLLEEPTAAVRAALLAARLAGASRAVLAVPEPHAGVVRAAADGADVEVRALPAEYPATLPVVVARAAARSGAPVTVFPLADAAAAATALESGRPPFWRVLTVLGPDGAPVGNFRVPIGTPLGDVLAGAGLEAHPGDKVITGGPFRGLAQYSLDAAVDGTVDGLLLVRAGAHPQWSEDPCVNCGSCLDVCPERLPAHLLARFAEFNRFDRAAECGLADCIECGLCATVCPARRPMLQRIRLAKREVATAEAAARAAVESGRPPEREPDPIPVPVAVGRED